MKNKQFIAIIFTIFLFLGLAFSVYKQNALFASKPQTASNAQKENIHMVSLLENRATPNALAIKVGESVQFNSKDGKTHHISSGPGKAYEDSHEHKGKGLESGVFGPDEGYRVNFKKTGNYEFHDHTNPDIFVTVIVYEVTDETARK